MDGAHEIFEGKREKYTGFWLGYLKERDLFEDPGIEERMASK
jgi:hypothetical protein